jgi:hypothetical protein
MSSRTSVAQRGECVPPGEELALLRLNVEYLILWKLGLASDEVDASHV